MRKGGLSTIVVTLIIILVSLVALGIIWLVVNNLILKGSEDISSSLEDLGIEESAVSENVLYNLTGNVSVENLIIKGPNPWTDVKAYGAKGDGINDDTAAIQAAIDNVEKAGGGTVFFPHGTYIVTSTITWKYGVRLMGDEGAAFVAGRYPEIRWEGAENGILLAAEQINANWHMTDINRLTFRGGNRKPATLIEFKDRVDYGTVCWKCQFAGTSGDAIRLLKGATNFYMYDFRADNIGGYLLYANGSFGGVYALDKFTYDTGGAGTANGLVFLDGYNAPNNQVSRLSVSNTRLEVNSNLEGDENALILLGVNPSISDYLQYQIILDNVFVAPATGAEKISLIKSVPSSDQFTVIGTGVHTGSAEIINGSITPGPVTNKISPFFVFAPFVRGAPGSNNQLISLISTLYVGGTVILAKNTTAIPCNTANAGAIIYSGNKHYGCDGSNWNPLY